MKKLFLTICTLATLNANVMESVCEVYKKDISADKCSRLIEQVNKLDNMLPRLTRKQRCKVIDDANIVFEVADGITEKRYTPTYLSYDNVDKKDYALTMFGNQALRYDIKVFIEFINGFNEMYNDCKGE